MMQEIKSLAASAFCTFGLLFSSHAVPRPADLVDLTDPVSGVTQGVASKDSATSLNAGSAARAFDNLPSSNWQDGRFLAKNASAPVPVSVAFTFKEAKVVNAYSIVITAGQYGNPSRAPKSWTVYGSTDYVATSVDNNCASGTWTEIVSVTEETGWTAGERRYFEMENATAYRSYKIVVTANNGDTSWTDIADIEFFDVSVKDLTQVKVAFAPSSATYDGKAHQPTYAVTMTDETTLTEGEDFVASWDKEGFVETGFYTLTLTPAEGSSFVGSKTAQFRILPNYPLPTWECSAPAVSTFVPMTQGENVAFGLSGNVTDGVLAKDNSISQYAGDYTISFDGPKDIYELNVYSAWDGGRDGFGIDKVYVKYYGEADYTWLTDVDPFPYTDKNQGSQCASLKNREKPDQPLARNVTAVRIHFSQCDNSFIGLGEVEVRGCETAVFDLDRAVITFDPEYVRYDGNEHKPEVTIAKEDGTVLTDGFNLIWNPSEMVNAGVYTLTVSPSEGSACKGSKTVQYRIWSKDGTGDPDTTDVVYTWKGNDSTQWDVVPNWNSSVIECFGFPSNTAHATAKFPAGVTATVVGQGQTFGLKGLSVNGDVTLSGMSLSLGDDIYGVNGGRLTLDGVMLDGNKSFQLFGQSAWIFKNGAGLTGGYLYRTGNNGATVTVLDGASELRELCDNNQNAPLTLAVTNGVVKFSNGSGSRWQIKANATVDLHDGAFQCSWVPNGKMASSFVWKVDCLNLPESAAASITFWNAGAYKTFLADPGNDDYTVASKIKVAYDRAFAEKGKLKWTPIIRFNIPAAEQSDALDEALKSMVEFVGVSELNSSSVKVERAGDVETIWAKASPPSGLQVIIR